MGYTVTSARFRNNCAFQMAAARYHDYHDDDAASVGLLAGVTTGGVQTYKRLANPYKGYPILEQVLNPQKECLHEGNQTHLTALSNSRFLMYVYWEGELRLIYIQRTKSKAVVHLFEIINVEQIGTAPRIESINVMERYLSALWKQKPASKRSAASVPAEVVWNNVSLEKLVKLFKADALARFANDAPSFFIVGTRLEPENGPALVNAYASGDGGVDAVTINAAALKTESKGEMYRVSPKDGNYRFPELGVRDPVNMPLPEPSLLYKLIVSGQGNVGLAAPALQIKAGILAKEVETPADVKARGIALKRYRLLLHETFQRQEKKFKEDSKAAKDSDASGAIQLQKSKKLSAYQLKVIALCQKLKPAKGAYAAVFTDDVSDISALGLSYALSSTAKPSGTRVPEALLVSNW